MPVALITGVSGQDGSYLAESLVAQGFDVHGVVHSATGSARPEFVDPAVDLHSLDITDTVALGELIARVSPDRIYSLAAVSSVFASWQDPVQNARVNALPVAQILESAWRLRESTGRDVRVVQASSAELFGQPDSAPQNEGTPIRPSSPYGAAKAFAHHLIGVYRQRGLFASSAILYNHESPRRPEAFVTRKITAAAARIAAGRQQTLQLGTLDVHRDWGWAPDYARALELAAEAAAPDDFVIATGATHSIADFVRLAFERAGVDDWADRVVLDPSFRRPVDPSEQVGDASKARRVLGWEPTVGFAEIVERMVDADIVIARTGDHGEP
jgi:GDPmannose 4,6-dehydratase